MLVVFVNPKGGCGQRDGSHAERAKHVSATRRVCACRLSVFRCGVRALRFRMCLRYISFVGGCDLGFGCFPVLYVSSSVVLFVCLFVCLCVCSPFVCWLMIGCVSTHLHFILLMSSCVTRFLSCPFFTCPEV